jgi:predicted RNase H-like HicB family nuclease
MKRFLIMLEQTEGGFAVQVPDLAIVTCGESIEAAKRAASEAIQINLEGYRDAGQKTPEEQNVSRHLGNPEFRDLLFAYVEVAEPRRENRGVEVWERCLSPFPLCDRVFVWNEGRTSGGPSRRYRYRYAIGEIPALTDGVITHGVSLGTFCGNEMTGTD